MSGLEPIAALGLVCNVFQLTETAGKLVTLAKTIYENGTIDPGLKDMTTNLENLWIDIEKKKAIAKSDPVANDAKRVLDLVAKAREVKEKLVKQIETIEERSRLFMVFQAVWKKAKLAMLEKDLERLQGLTQSSLIMYAGNRNDIKLDELSGNLHTFVLKYRQGQKDWKVLLSKEGVETRKFVTVEADKTRLHVSEAVKQSENQVQSHVTDNADRTVVAIDRTEQTVHGYAATAEQKLRRRKLFGSFKFKAMNARKTQIRDKSLDKGTFEWLFKDDESGSSSTIKWDSFSKWLKSSEKTTYWISGKPGSGKSTLVNFIISHEQTQNQLRACWHVDERVTIISYFMWKPGSLMQKTVKGMLCTLLDQLLVSREDLLDWMLGQDFSPWGSYSEATDWSDHELETVLLDVLQKYGHPVCIFIDGIDEVDSSEGLDKVLNLIGRVANISARVKVCLASRPEFLIRKRLSGCKKLFLEHLTYSDLATYASSHLKIPSRLLDQDSHSPKTWWDEFVDEIVRKAHGVFLWLCLAVENINQGTNEDNSPEELRSRMMSLPEEIAAMYQEMWSRLGKSQEIYQKDASLMLAGVLAFTFMKDNNIPIDPDFSTIDIVMFKEFSLTRKILVDGKSSIKQRDMIPKIHETEEKARIRCAGLLQVVVERIDLAHYESSLQFIHRTAYDFLIDTAEGQKILGRKFGPKTVLRLMQAHLATYYLQSTSEDPYPVHPFDITGELDVLSTIGRRINLNNSEFADHLIRHLKNIWKACVVMTDINEFVTDDPDDPDGRDFIKLSGPRRTSTGDNYSWFLARAASQVPELFLLALSRRQIACSKLLLHSVLFYAVRSTNILQDTLQLLKWLLAIGVDVDFRLRDTRKAVAIPSNYFATTFTACLEYLIDEGECPALWWRNNAAGIFLTLAELVKAGASLASPMRHSFSISCHYDLLLDCDKCGRKLCFDENPRDGHSTVKFSPGKDDYQFDPYDVLTCYLMVPAAVTLDMLMNRVVTRYCYRADSKTTTVMNYLKSMVKKANYSSGGDIKLGVSRGRKVSSTKNVDLELYDIPNNQSSEQLWKNLVVSMTRKDHDMDITACFHACGAAEAKPELITLDCNNKPNQRYETYDNETDYETLGPEPYEDDAKIELELDDDALEEGEWGEYDKDEDKDESD